MRYSFGAGILAPAAQEIRSYVLARNETIGAKPREIAYLEQLSEEIDGFPNPSEREVVVPPKRRSHSPQDVVRRAVYEGRRAAVVPRVVRVWGEGQTPRQDARRRVQMYERLVRAVPSLDACARDRHFLGHSCLMSLGLGGACRGQRREQKGREEIATIEVSPSSENASAPQTSLGHFSQVDQEALSTPGSVVAMRMSSELVRKSIVRHRVSYTYNVPK